MPPHVLSSLSSHVKRNRALFTGTYVHMCEVTVLSAFPYTYTHTHTPSLLLDTCQCVQSVASQWTSSYLLYTVTITRQIASPMLVGWCVTSIHILNLIYGVSILLLRYTSLYTAKWRCIWCRESSRGCGGTLDSLCAETLLGRTKSTDYTVALGSLYALRHHYVWLLTFEKKSHLAVTKLHCSVACKKNSRESILLPPNSGLRYIFLPGNNLNLCSAV